MQNKIKSKRRYTHITEDIKFKVFNELLNNNSLNQIAKLNNIDKLTVIKLKKELKKNENTQLIDTIKKNRIEQYKILLDKYLAIMLTPEAINKFKVQSSFYQCQTAQSIERSMALAEGRPIVTPERSDIPTTRVELKQFIVNNFRQEKENKNKIIENIVDGKIDEKENKVIDSCNENKTIESNNNKVIEDSVTDGKVTEKS